MKTVPNGGAPIIVVCGEDNRYYAIRGICPHQGARLGKGHLTSLTASETPGVYGMEKDRAILRCPWHSFDYDIASGRCVSDPRLRVKTYPVHVENGEIMVDL